MHRRLFRSPTSGTCGTTSPSTSRRPLPASAASTPPPQARLVPLVTAALQQLSVNALANRAEQGLLVPRTRSRYQQVHASLAEGHSIRKITRRLGLTRGAVRRFARATTVDDFLAQSAVCADSRQMVRFPFNAESDGLSRKTLKGMERRSAQVKRQ